MKESHSKLGKIYPTIVKEAFPEAFTRNFKHLLKWPQQGL